MIVDTIKGVVSNLTQSVTFVYANIYEADYQLDNLVSETGWFFIYISPTEKTDRIGNQNEYHTSFNFGAYIVKRLDNQTIDYSSLEVQPCIDEALEIGRQFIHLLGQESVIDYNPTYSQGITEVRYVSEYGFQDTHLFGISLQATVPIYEGKTGCDGN